MTPVQAPAPPLRLARGLVFFRMRAYPVKGSAAGAQRPGQVIARMRAEALPPPVGAEAWKPAGGQWSYEFGGRWLERGDGRLTWEWTDAGTL